MVNCLGVLQDGARDDVRRVHVAATCALFDACARRWCHRLVHISMIGADAAAPTEFARSKAEADDYLTGLDLDWLILRPGLVLSPAAYGGTAMLRAIAACPLVTPIVAAEARMQVVSVADVARTVAFASSRARRRARSGSSRIRKSTGSKRSCWRCATGWADRRGRSGACRRA